MFVHECFKETSLCDGLRTVITVIFFFYVFNHDAIHMYRPFLNLYLATQLTMFFFFFLSERSLNIPDLQFLVVMQMLMSDSFDLFANIKNIWKQVVG